MEEESGGFAFDGGVGGDDDFFDGVFGDAGEEFFDVELVGRDAVNGGDGAAEDVIGAFVLFSGFDSVDVEWFFNHEDRGFVARGVGVKRGEAFARVDKGESFWAGLDAGVERGESFRNVGGNLRVGTEQKVGVTFRRAGTDTWEMTERFNDASESLGKH